MSPAVPYICTGAILLALDARALAVWMLLLALFSTFASKNKEPLV